AARNVSGQVHMYADTVTPSMRRAIDETSRRRAKQVAYNEANGINPQPLRKRIADILDQIVREDADTEQLIGGGGRQQSRGKAPVPGLSSRARAVAAPGGERQALVQSGGKNARRGQSIRAPPVEIDEQPVPYVRTSGKVRRGLRGGWRGGGRSGSGGGRGEGTGRRSPPGGKEQAATIH